MKKHHQKEHADELDEPKWSPCAVQQYNSGVQREYFRVKPTDVPSQPGDTSTHTALIEEVLRSDDEGEEPVPDARHISPWLLSTGWHLHTHEWDAAELRRLVEVPKKGELLGLYESVKDYFQWATSQIGSVQELVRQRLMTPEPVK